MDPSSPRTLNQILADLGPSYDTTINSYKSQQDAITPWQNAQMQGLSMAKDNAFTDILNGSRERGVGFGGIPLQNQGKYIGSTYIPAIANLERDANNQRSSLTDAINAAMLDRTKTANTLYTTEQGNYNDYLAKLAAAKASASGGITFNTGDSKTTPTATASGPKGTKNADGTHSFVDAAGQPISAAVYYAQVTNGKGNNFRGFLEDLAKDGDKGAGSALNFVGNDYRYDKSKVTSQSLANLYNALIWGATDSKGNELGQASYKAPTPSYAQQNAGKTIGGQTFSLYK